MPARPYVAVIDDEVSICRSLGRLLQNSGLHSIAYTSAEDFLDDQLRVPFACLLIDVQLGGMSGLELHRRLVACQVRIPVIYITAHDDPNVRRDALANGAVAYFRKSDPGADIIAAVRQALRTTTHYAGHAHVPDKTTTL
jgi:FixJ family two-component response regulator